MDGIEIDLPGNQRPLSSLGPLNLASQIGPQVLNSQPPLSTLDDFGSSFIVGEQGGGGVDVGGIEIGGMGGMAERGGMGGGGGMEDMVGRNADMGGAVIGPSGEDSVMPLKRKKGGVASDLLRPHSGTPTTTEEQQRAEMAEVSPLFQPNVPSNSSSFASAPFFVDSSAYPPSSASFALPPPPPLVQSQPPFSPQPTTPFSALVSRLFYCAQNANANEYFGVFFYDGAQHSQPPDIVASAQIMQSPDRQRWLVFVENLSSRYANTSEVFANADIDEAVEMARSLALAECDETSAFVVRYRHNDNGTIDASVIDSYRFSNFQRKKQQQQQADYYSNDALSEGHFLDQRREGDEQKKGGAGQTEGGEKKVGWILWVIGGVALLFVLALAAFFVIRYTTKRKRQQKKEREESESSKKKEEQEREKERAAPIVGTLTL